MWSKHPHHIHFHPPLASLPNFFSSPPFSSFPVPLLLFHPFYAPSNAPRKSGSAVSSSGGPGLKPRPEKLFYHIWSQQWHIVATSCVFLVPLNTLVFRRRRGGRCALSESAYNRYRLWHVSQSEQHYDSVCRCHEATAINPAGMAAVKLYSSVSSLPRLLVRPSVRYILTTSRH